MLVFAVVCFVIKPTAFLSNTALSYYGTQPATIIPYGLGMLLTAFFLHKGAQQLHGKKVAFVKHSVLSIALLLVATFLTPYSAGYFFFAAHMVVTLLMMFVVLGASAYILLKIDRSPLNVVIALLDLLMFIFVVLSFGFWDILHVQAVAQLGASLLFIGLLYNTLKDFSEEV